MNQGSCYCQCLVSVVVSSWRNDMCVYMRVANDVQLM